MLICFTFPENVFGHRSKFYIQMNWHENDENDVKRQIVECQWSLNPLLVALGLGILT